MRHLPVNYLPFYPFQISGSHDNRSSGSSSQEPTRRLTPRSALLSNHVHLIALFDEAALVRCQSGDRLGLLDIRARDEFALLQTARVLE